MTIKRIIYLSDDVTHGKSLPRHLERLIPGSKASLETSKNWSPGTATADLVLCDEFLDDQTIFDVLSSSKHPVICLREGTGGSAELIAASGAIGVAPKFHTEAVATFTRHALEKRPWPESHVESTVFERMMGGVNMPVALLHSSGRIGQVGGGDTADWYALWSEHATTIRKAILGMPPDVQHRSVTVRNGSLARTIQITRAVGLPGGRFMAVALPPEAEESDNAWLQTLRSVAHDLANPLAIILMQLRLLEQEDQSDGARTRSAVIEASARRMQALALSAIDMTRLGSGGLTPHYSQENLATLGQDLELTFSHLAGAKDINFQVEAQDTKCTLDKRMAGQILYNLVDNSFKFTAAGGSVRVELMVEDELVIRVTDSGVGFDSEGLRDAFKLFERSNESRSDAPGFGIGLHHIRNIAQLMDGHVTVESEGIQQGSTFTARIPIPHL